MPKAKKEKAENKPKEKDTKYSKTANVLALIAVGFLVLLGILMIAFKSPLVSYVQQSVENIAITESDVIYESITCFLFAAIIFIVNYKIKKTNRAFWKWTMYCLSLLLIVVFARIPEGILLNIAGLLYLRQK